MLPVSNIQIFSSSLTLTHHLIRFPIISQRRCDGDVLNARRQLPSHVSRCLSEQACRVFSVKSHTNTVFTKTFCAFSIQVYFSKRIFKTSHRIPRGERPRISLVPFSCCGQHCVFRRTMVLSWTMCSTTCDLFSTCAHRVMFPCCFAAFPETRWAAVITQRSNCNVCVPNAQSVHLAASIEVDAICFREV